MNIAIIGTGNVGKALGAAWCKHGHTICFGSRDPEGEKAKAAVAAARAVAATGASVCACAPAEAAEGADVIVLATPWSATKAAIASLGTIDGAVLVDATNPIAPGLQLALGHTTSGGEQVAQWAHGAHVVKAFNITGANNMTNPDYGGAAATMFICGDDIAAKRQVAQLATEIGFDVADVGGISMARYLEPMAMVWIHCSREMGREIAFRMMKR